MHNAAALTTPDNWTELPAVALTAAPASGAHLPSAGVPMLIPITIPAGVTAVRVASTVPVDAAWNVWKSLPPTATVPVKVSVVRVVAEVVAAAVVEPLPPHATVPASASIRRWPATRP